MLLECNSDLNPMKYLPSSYKEAKHFYEESEATNRPLFEISIHSKLFIAIRLLSIKVDRNISQADMDSFNCLWVN